MTDIINIIYIFLIIFRKKIYLYKLYFQFITGIYNSTAAFLDALFFTCNIKPYEAIAPSKPQRKHVGNKTVTTKNPWIHRVFPGCPTFDCAQWKCLSRRGIAAKVIRHELIETVAPRLTAKGAIVLYLVRDPRGIFSSRLKIHGGRSNPGAFLHKESIMKNQKALVQMQCNNIARNVQYIKDCTTCIQPNCAGNVIVLRYEDFAHNPYTMSEKLYEYLNIPMPQNVTTYIERSTNVVKGVGIKGRPDPYGTKRNSEATAENWRTYLPFEYVEVIQNICGQLLTDLGYEHVNLNSLKRMNETVVTAMSNDLPHL